MSPRVKICCITTAAERDLAVAAGADALGFVGPMPSGPGTLTLDEIAGLIDGVPPGVSSFLLSAETRPEGIIAAVERTRPSVVQLVDAVSIATHDTLRRACPSVRRFQVIHVQGPADVDAAIEMAPHVDALLLDSGRPNAPRRSLGGTGQTHDWSLSRQIVDRSPCPVYLAGGLGPDNVELAIARVRPFGVDVCSRLRPRGTLDPELARRFVEAAARAGLAG